MLHLIAEFLDACQFERGVRPSTLKAYKSILSCFAAWSGGTPPTAENIRPYIRSLMERGIKPPSLHTIKRVIHAFLVWRKDGDPAEAGRPEADAALALLEKTTLPKEVSTARALSAEQVKAWLMEPNIYTSAGLRDRTVLELLYGCGLRIGEVASLRRSDLDPQEGYIHIRAENAKGKRDRSIKIPRMTLEFVRRWCGALAETESEWLFPSEKTASHLTTNALRQMARKLAVAAGIGRQKPHTLRHSCATHLIQNNASLLAVQGILGHAQISTTEKYLHFSQMLSDKAMDSCHPRSQIEEIVIPLRVVELPLEKINSKKA